MKIQIEVSEMKYILTQMNKSANWNDFHITHLFDAPYAPVTEFSSLRPRSKSGFSELPKTSIVAFVKRKQTAFREALILCQPL